MNNLSKSLSDLAESIEEETEPQAQAYLSCSDVVSELEMLAHAAAIVEVLCIRCDRRFRSLPEVKYCTRECELGGVQMPYQTQALQQYHLDKVGRGKA